MEINSVFSGTGDHGMLSKLPVEMRSVRDEYLTGNHAY